MVSLTLSISEELKKKMAKHPEIKWSEVVRSVLEKQINDIEEADRIASKSKLTQKDAEELATLVNKGVAKRWREEIERHERKR
jgi:methyl coenzyme M reductase subunit C-like uncharacterized protein (methanogenesis marker protein 7)